MSAARPVPPGSLAETIDLIEEAEEHIQNAGYVLALEEREHAGPQPNDLLMKALCNLRHARKHARAVLKDEPC